MDAVLGRPSGHAVDELLDACLLIQAGRGRLRLPRLARGYVAGQAGRLGVDLDAAFDRALRRFRDRAVAADLSEGDRLRLYPVPEGLSWPVTPPVSHVDPIDWLEAESGTIAGLVAQAYHRRRHVEVGQLCGALEVLLTKRGHHWLVAAANEWGIRAATELGEPLPLARLHAMQGRVYTILHRFPAAQAALDTAAGLMVGRDHPRLESSILEFRARLHEERAEAASPGEHARAVEYAAAVAALRRGVDIDRGTGASRALGLHARMLANILVKAGAIDGAPALLDEAATHTFDVRNAARVHLVRAKMHAALDELDPARTELARARVLTAQSGATQYEFELAEVEADIAVRAGDLDTARSCWGWAAEAYYHSGHPKFDVYLRRLNSLPPPRR